MQMRIQVVFDLEQSSAFFSPVAQKRICCIRRKIGPEDGTPTAWL
jgi:hypothetical protein